MILAIFSLSMLGSMGIPAVASATGPGTICVIQIQSTGPVLGVFVNQPTGFNIAVLVPEDPDKIITVPASCDMLETLALAVANQKNQRITVTTQVFTNQGELFCANGSISVPRNGARGIIFSGCQ